MKVYDFRNDSGNITALFLVEAAEVFPTTGDADEAMEQAITNAIYSLAEVKGVKFMFPKILSYDEQDDGAVMISMEAAVAPEVHLGQYKGLSVPAADDADAFAQRALELAAANIDAEVPGMIIERELDTLRQEKKSEVLQNIHLNLLTDIYKILEVGIEDVTTDYKKEELWQLAMQTVDIYFGEGKPDVSLDNMVSSVANVLSMYGRITDELCGKLARIIEKRMEERDKLTGEALADQVFETYLHVSNMSETQWDDQNRPDAVERARQNLTLDAVADAEALTISDAELNAELRNYADEFGITLEQVKEFVGEEALRYQLRRDKARNLIASTAVRI